MQWIAGLVAMVIQLLLMAIQFLLAVVSLVVPAVFQVFVWVTANLFAMVGSLGGHRLAPGGLILLSSLGWGGTSLLFLPWVQIFVEPMTALLLLAATGGVWGLCVGQRAALLWQTQLLRRPDTDTQRLFGLPPHFFRSSESQKRNQSIDELWRDGIILGETEGEDEL